MSDPHQEECAEACRVFDALQSYVNRIDQLITQVESKLRPQFIDVDLLKAETQALKNEIKEAKNYGTIDGGRQPRSLIEKMYFSSAIQKASAAFSLRADVSPLNPKWVSGLRVVEHELTYSIYRLKQQFPHVSS